VSWHRDRASINFSVVKRLPWERASLTAKS
jgi:hypothetical protein